MPKQPGQEVRQRHRSWPSMFIAWALVVVWAVFIFYMSAHSGNDLNEGTDFVARVKQWLNALQMQLFGADIDLVSSIAHFCEYTVFGVLLAHAFSGFTRLHDRQGIVIMLAIVLASVYAVTDEIHQIFVPDRVCDVADWIIDVCGATLGSLLWSLTARRLQL